MATFQHLLRRASTYLNLSNNRSKNQSLSDGEIVYSKNNVCIHTNDKQTNALNHNLGYLTVKCHYTNTLTDSEDSDQHKWTLCFQWTSNESLTTNWKPLEQNCDNHDNYEYFNENKVQNHEVFYSDSQTNTEYSFGTNFTNSLQSLDNLSLNLSTTNDMNSLRSIQIGSFDDNINRCNVSLITQNNNNNNENTTNSSHESDNELKRSLSTSKCDMKVTSKNSLTVSPVRLVRRCQSCRTTPIKRKLSKESSFTTFTVDLRQIKFLKLFFDGENSSQRSIDNCCDSNDSTSGHLVIVRRDDFFKVFHFHTGGLDKLSHVLSDWDFFRKSDKSKETNYLQFTISEPELKTEECHPDEKLYDSINEIEWKNSINELGQIINESNLRKTIFFAGIDPSLRREIWPFLLHRYDFNSTYSERESDDLIKREEYYRINQKLESMNQNEKEQFWRNVQSIVEKDVVRTDRSNPFFAGDNNGNIDKMKRILINFGLYFPSMGYTQGMSDLLAPLLREIQCEDQTFWCFVGMMRFTHFVCSPKDTDMDHNLALLLELLRLMFPQFYAHIRQFSDDLELLFTHRWILLCFKREFNEIEALHIWESCWAQYQTNYFHLFICLAIILFYGKEVLTHNMDSDEILFYFSTLSMNMDGNKILRKARGLFHKFCVLRKIPCTLRKLTNLSGLEMWESNKEQLIECVKGFPNKGDLCQCNTKPND